MKTINSKNRFKQGVGMEQSDFLYPRARFRGEFTPANLAFDANLQEFSQRISYICCLETSGKISPEESFEQIKTLWKALKTSKKQLGIGMVQD